MLASSQDIAVIVGTASPELGAKICAQLGIKACASEVITFSEGNTFVRILENVRGKDTYIIQGVNYPVDRILWNCCSGSMLSSSHQPRR